MQLSHPAVALFLAVTACGSAVADATGDVDGGPTVVEADASVAPTPPEVDAGVDDADSGPPQVCGVAAATQVPLESAQAVEDFLGVDRWAWEACAVTRLCPESEPLLLFVHENESLYRRCGHFCDRTDGGVCKTQGGEHPIKLVDAGAGRFELRTGFDDISYSFDLTAWSAEGPAIQLDGRGRQGGTFRKATAPAK